MENKRQKPKNRITALALLLSLCLTACGGRISPAEETAAPEDLSRDAEKVRISEVMMKNRSGLRDEDGDFSDWVELENLSREPLSLKDWQLSDREDGEAWRFPEVEIPAGGYLLVYTDGKDKGLHTDFELDAGETLYLRNAFGYPAAQLLCGANEADVSLAFTGGGYEESFYQTPGCPNTAEFHELWQQGMIPQGPLCIQRVAVANQSGEQDGEDWVQLQNLSGQTLDLADFYLSDDHKDYKRYALPEKTLEAGKSYVLRCDEGVLGANFALDSSNEQLFLSDKEGNLLDYVSLKNIPYDCSYGRVDGGSGWYYIEGSSPKKQGRSFRRVSQMPESLFPDGVFNGVDEVSVELSGPGALYYTLDGSLPTEASLPYEGPLTLRETGIVRAICVEEGAMPSRPLTLSYILNENHSLPVLSLVSNDRRDFKEMYSTGRKSVETPASLSLYEEDGSFTIPCGVKMHGETSLILPKKNMSVRFRGSYGQEELNYDIYDGGVTNFTNLVLRAGQDYYQAIIRNELCQNLCLAATDNVISQRSKYCILYIDGQYWGIYALMEKPNEQHYANLAGVSRDSVTVEQAKVWENTELYQTVFRFCYEHDMSQPENYATFCSRMDVDSLIDWLILEGFCANADLSIGNLRYCKSAENDGLWRLMFYDLDASLRSPQQNFGNVIHSYPLNFRQYGTLVNTLLENEEFVDRFLSRAAELFRTELTNETLLQEIDRLAAQIAPEVERDYVRYGMSYEKWERNIDWLKNFVVKNDWTNHSIDAICELLDLDEAQRQHYFG